MKKEFISKPHTLSLLRNGNLSAGLGHWFGSYLRHVKVKQPSSEAPIPAYAVSAAVADAAYFPDGIPVGLNQFVDHPALFTFPSRRTANRVEMFIVDENRAYVRLLPESTVDGAPNAVPVTHPFLFSDFNGHVPVKPGSDVLLVNYDKVAYSGTYKAGGVVQNFGPLGASSGVEFHILELGSAKLSFLSSVDIVIDSSTTVSVSTITSTTKQLVFFGDAPNLTTVFRQLDSTLQGVQPGDSVVMDTNSGAYYAVVYAATATSLQIQPVSAQGKEMLPFLPNGDVIRRVRVFSTTVARVSVEKPVFRYEYTLAYSRDAGSTFVVPNPTLKFKRLTYDSVNDEYSLTGVGDDGPQIPKLDRDTQVVNRIDQGTDSWERVLEHFFLESREPIDGRLLFTMGAPNTLYTGVRQPVTSVRYHISGTTPVFDITVTTPVTYSSGDRLELIDSINTLDPDFWYNQVLKGRTLFVISASGQTVTVANPTIKTAAELTTLIGGVNVLYTLAINTHASSATRIVDSGLFLVSDIFLAKEDYSQGLFRFDDPPDSIDQRPLVDPLVANADLLDNALPSGVTVLYAGGGTCPPGYKRLDGLNSSAIAGVPGYHILPDPDSRDYDTTTNRTTLTWNSASFAAPVSSENTTLTTLSVTRDVPLAIPDNPVEKVTVFPAIPAIQPGMFLGTRPIDAVADLKVLDESNPVLGLGDTPRAIRLEPTGAVATHPYVELDSVGNAYEMWFKLDALGSSTPERQVLLQRMSFPTGFPLPGGPPLGQITGWEVYLHNDLGTPAGTEAQLVLNIFTGSTRAQGPAHTWNSASGSLPQIISYTSIGKWLFLYIEFTQVLNSTQVRLALYEANSTNPIVNTTQTFTSLLPSDFSSFTTPSSVITAGRGNRGTAAVPTANTLDRGASITLDLLRVYDAPLAGTETHLFNNGKGRPLVDENITSNTNAVLYMNEGQGVLLQNTAATAPSGFTGDGVLIAPAQTRWVVGYLRSTTSTDAYTGADYAAPYEDRISQYLISDLTIDIGNQLSTKLVPSATVANPGPRGQFGDGAGNISYPYVVFEDDYVNAGNTSDRDFKYAFPEQPIGPIGFGVVGKQDNVFRYAGTPAGRLEIRLVKRLSSTRVSIDVGEVIRKTDFFNSTLVQSTQYIDSVTPAIGKAFVQDAKVGDVYYLNWRHSDGDRYGEFFAEIESITPKTVSGKLTAEVVLRRYDRRPIIFNCDVNTFLSRTSSNLRPAKLFGIGKQTRPNQTTIGTPGVTMQQLTVQTGGSTKKIWSVRAIDYSVAATVYGDASDPARRLFVEPSGYLRFGDSEQLIDYGTSGHSHIVDKKDTAITVDNLVPVLKFGSTQFTDTPFTDVASEHDHGYLEKHRWPLPPFKLFTVCTKL